MKNFPVNTMYTFLPLKRVDLNIVQTTKFNFQFCYFNSLHFSFKIFKQIDCQRYINGIEEFCPVMLAHLVMSH